MFTPYIGIMQHLDLSDEEAAALIKELADITRNDRYPFSTRIQTLGAILAKLRPEPARNLAAAVIVKPFDPPVSRNTSIFESFRSHRLVPVTTISTCRPPHREQTSRSRQSSTEISAPYLAPHD
jgi:hypothetical protein